MRNNLLRAAGLHAITPENLNSPRSIGLILLHDGFGPAEKEFSELAKLARKRRRKGCAGSGFSLQQFLKPAPGYGRREAEKACLYDREAVGLRKLFLAWAMGETALVNEPESVEWMWENCISRTDGASELAELASFLSKEESDLWWDSIMLAWLHLSLKVSFARMAHSFVKPLEGYPMASMWLGKDFPLQLVSTLGDVPDWCKYLVDAHKERRGELIVWRVSDSSPEFVPDYNPEAWEVADTGRIALVDKQEFKRFLDLVRAGFRVNSVSVRDSGTTAVGVDYLITFWQSVRALTLLRSFSDNGDDLDIYDGHLDHWPKYPTDVALWSSSYHNGNKTYPSAYAPDHDISEEHQEWFDEYSPLIDFILPDVKRQAVELWQDESEDECVPYEGDECDNEE